jgi:hypothetical protein
MRLFFLIVYFAFAFDAPAATQAEIYILRDELNIERQKLQSIDDELGQLNRQQRSLKQDMTIRIADAIRDNNVEIQNLTDLLQTQRSREAAIDLSTDSYLNQIIAASRANQERINSSIQSSESDLRQLQDLINFTPLYRVSASFTADPARQSLQSEYTQQAQLLSNLREQRERQSLLQIEQIQQLNNDRAFQKNQLYEDLSSLQESLSALRSENARLEAQRVQAQLNLSSVEQQLSEQQKRREEQQRRVQTLDSALQKRSFE